MKLHSVWKIFLICIFILNLVIPSCMANNFDVSGFETSTSTDVSTKAQEVLGQVAGIVRMVGTGIAIIILTVIACKYMISAPGDRADIKKNAIPFVIGAVVLFGASGIFGIIADFAGGIKLN